MIDFLVNLFNGGIAGIADYVSAHVLFCLIPAFFFAGAINTSIPQAAVLKYLGRKTKKWVSYTVAAAGGFILTVCSCTILPLFAGIWKRGAGLGPAITFLYAGPAISILAITYTASLIGWDIAIARIVLSITFAVLTGLIIEAVTKDDKRRTGDLVVKQDGPARPGWQNLAFFTTLLSILIIGTFPLFDSFRVQGSVLLTLLIVLMSWKFYEKTEILQWLSETWTFFVQIFPTLLVGVFFAGALKVIIPPGLIAALAGSNTILANLIAVLFGVFAYFPTLVEVPLAKTFLDLGMHKGPLLAYLLADPVISLQSMLVLDRVMGRKNTLLYAGLITIECTLAGWIFGMLV